MKTGRPKKGSLEEGKSFIQGICEICGKNKQRLKGRNKQGKRKYSRRCNPCSPGCLKKHLAKIRKKYCEECGFIAVHQQQLVLHHIDRNRKNNRIDNLVTLCLNCHKLKHIRTWKSRYIEKRNAG